ncbi:hypothetical protein [Bilophila wadsworthia]|uniref:hypothetical protein n=1 Tax=Bilophila wadsworthia TaxID=35833 RepID=UPI0032207F86
MSQAFMDQWKKEDEMGSLYMDRGQGVRAAFEASSDLSGQDVAESLRLAKSLGIPENIVLEQRDWAAQEEKARTIEKNSLLAQWAEKDRKNAAFVRDDPDALLDLFEDIQIERRDEENRRRAWEERHGSIRQTYVGPLEQIPMLLEEGLRDVGYSVGGFISGAARFLGNGTFTDSEGNVHPYRSNLLDSFADRVEKNLSEKRKADPARLQAETEIGGYAQDVIRQIPQLGAQILATVGTGGLGGVSFMGSQIAGGQYLDLRERGVEADRAFKAGLANAALQAPLEQIGLGRFMNIFKATGGRAIAKRVLEGTGTEALTEYLQTYPESATELWALLHEDEGAREWLDQFVAALPETHREGLYSAAVAAPFGLLGGLGRAAYDRTRAQEAENFVEREKALHAKVEATQVKKLSPESTESALRAGGMTGNVLLPADKVLQLYQSGQDILTPLGLQEQDVIDAAQMGQELEIPHSRLHAMLDQPSFDAVVSFMRPAEDAMTLEEAADVETRISEDAETLGAVYAEYQAEQSTIDAEVERVRSEIESSLKSVPGVATQIESDTALDEVARGERMTPERVADLYSSLLLNWAQRRQERTGIPVAESLRRFNVQGLVRDQRGRLMTPEDLEKSIVRTEQQAADREFLGHILGRLDVNSLVKDYPDARKELTAIYGQSLFEKRKRKKDGGYVVKKGTNGIDELAQELENRGLIESGGGADALIERLKQGKRYYQFIDPARVQANPNARDVVPVLRRVFHMNTMELDDSKATVTVPREEGMSGPLTDIYQHDALYELYPELLDAQYEVVPEERLPGKLAGYSPKYGTIYITTDPDVTPSVIAHEVQHAIQDVDERFDFGLSEEASQEVYSQVEQELKGKLPLERARALAARIQYLSQAHEIQAFDTQNRFELTADERAKYEPNNPSTYYQYGAKIPRASIIPVSDGYLIQLYKKADLSSLLHETGHFFMMEMEQDIQAGIADDSMRADYVTLMNWLDATEGEPLTREQHEQFARGFEAYLREGKAPSKSLESPFARFKKWLLRIYRQARQLNVELTDDVRGVFDRLLATDAEVNARAVENGLTDLSAHELDALGVQGADRIVVSNLMKAAADTAVEKLQQDRDRRRQQQLRIWAKEAREEVDTMPVYVARRDIQKLGLDMETVRREYGDQAERLMRSLPGSLRREGGVDPELFALEHGYEDAGSMFSAILEAPRKPERIRQVIAEKQAAWDATFNATDYLLETDEAARQMEFVGRYIREAMGKTVAGQDATPTQEDFQDFGRNAQRVVKQEAFQRIVSQKLAAMPAGKAVQAGIFRLAMRMAISEERRAIVRGNWGKAFDANIKARLNMEFARQATELGRRIDSLRGNVTRFVHMAKADPDSRFLVGALAQHYGLGRLDPRLITDDRNNPITVLDTWIQKAETDGYPVFVDAGLLSGQDMGWRELSLDTLENVADALNQIMTVERNRRKLFTAQGKADLDAVADEIVATVGKFRDAPAVKTVEKENPVTKILKNVHAIHTKVEALCLALDGDRPGPVWEHIYRPITKAEDEQSKRFRAARDELRKLFSVYSRKELAQMRIKKEYVESIGEKLTKENRLAVALNLGNAVNIERIRSGHGWTDEQIRDVVRPLTRRDWEFVQSVRDYLNTFKEDSFRLQEEVTGIRPKAVEAQPLQVTTADGETLNQRGGYYPIKYNAEKGVRAFEREQKAMDQELFGGRNYGGAQTRQGHLKERAAGGTGEPLLLELSVITDHVFNVIHDLSYRKAVLDVAKVLRHDKVKKAIRSAVGTEMYNQLKPWLMDVANERQEPMHAVHRMANWARASTSIMQMGWKITTMLAQPLGITQTAEVLGYKDTAAGMKKVYADPLHLPDLLEETFARSPMMADRIRSYDREIRDMTKKLMPSLGLFGWVDKIRDSAFIPMGVFQMGVDLPTWWGGYTKGLREFNGDEIRAAEYADSVVRMAQGSGSTKDLARVQRGGPLLRLTTMFYSYFNTFYNLAARRFTSLRKDHSPAAVFQAANTALLLWFVPSVLGELAVGRGPDDDEEWENWMGMQILQYPFQAVVGIRELASGIFGEYGYQITPAESAPTALVKWFKAVNKALEEEDAEKLARPTAEAVGYLFGLPMKQPIITVGNVWDYVTGNDPDFYIRDLFFVKPKERR